MKFLGRAGMVAWAAAVFAALALAWRYLPAILRRVTHRHLTWLVGATLVLLVAAFAVGYPIANSGRFGGGSDREDNLNVATQALLRGEDPYAVRGYLGLPVDVLGGAFSLNNLHARFWNHHESYFDFVNGPQKTT